MPKSVLRFSVHVPGHNLAKKVLFPQITEMDPNVTTDSYEMTGFQIKKENLITFVICSLKRIRDIKSLKENLEISIQAQSIDHKIRECFLKEMQEKFSVEMPILSWEFANFSLDPEVTSGFQTAVTINHHLRHLVSNVDVGEWK